MLNSDMHSLKPQAGDSVLSSQNDESVCSTKRSSLAEVVIQRALKKPDQEEFVFKDGLVRFCAVKGHILPSLCHHKASIKCVVCEFENELKLPSLPEMIFADNRLEVYVPASATQPLIQFNAYDALKLVNATTLPNIMVEASAAWQKARSQQLPKISSPFDWTYTSDYSGTLATNTRVEATDETINLSRLMRRDPIHFYAVVPLYEDELADNGCGEMTVKVRVMSSNYFVLCRFYLRVDRVFVRVYDCRLYAEEDWNYCLRECTKRESLYADIKKEHHAIITDTTQIWQHLPIVEQKVERIYYGA